MNRTRDWLRRPAGGVEPKKDSRKSSSNDSAHASSTSPRKGVQDGSRSGGNGNDEEKRWKQKLTDTKLFKRLLQPTYVTTDRSGGSGSGGRHSTDESNVVPRLGEIPVRSKYYRAEQENSHFATTAEYLPLAEMCGPPSLMSTTTQSPTHPPHSQSQSPTSPTQQQKRETSDAPSHHRSRSRKHRKHRHSRGHHRRDSGGSEVPYEGLEDYGVSGAEDEEEDEEDDTGVESDEEEAAAGDDDDDDEDRDAQFGFGELHGPSSGGHISREDSGDAGSGLRENVVRAIPGSVQRRSYGSTGSTTSATSSIGPTGLALLPQFRWVPRPGGGGHGFNPFMAFRRPHPPPPPQQQQPQPPQRSYNSPEHREAADTPHTLVSQASRGDDESPSPLPQQEGQQMTASLSAVGARHSSYGVFYDALSPAPQRGTASLPLYNSFYGPIGTLGLEASRKRRQLELENGAEGDAEKAYKERTARRTTRFDEDSILLITKAWCDPDMLRTARVVDSPQLPDDDDDESSSDSAANIMDWESSSDDVAGGKPPVYDAATMAAREARVRKERIRQERRRYQPAESPSFYFAGDELADLRPPTEEINGRTSGSPTAEATTNRGGVAANARPPASSQPAQQRATPTQVKSPQPNKSANDDDNDDGSSSSSSHSLDRSSDDDDGNDDGSSTDSDSDSASDGSSHSGSDDDEEERNGTSLRDRSQHDDSVTQAPTRGQRQRQRTRGVPPDTSISAAVGRSVTGDAGQYDFMNSSVIDGPGGSLLFPPDVNEASVVPTALMTPFHHLGTAASPMEGNAGDRPAGVAAPLPAPPKSPARPSTTVTAAVDRAASGNGATAANTLREMKRVKKSQGGPTTQASPSRSVNNASVNSYYGGAGDISVYGSSFHLHDARPLYSPAEDGEAEVTDAPLSPVLTDTHGTTTTATRTKASPIATGGKTSGSPPTTTAGNAQRERVKSPADYMTAMRELAGPAGKRPVHAPGDSLLGLSIPGRTPSATSAIQANNANRNAAPSSSSSQHNNNNGSDPHASIVSPVGMSMSAAGYNARSSSVVPGISPSYTVGTSRPVSLTPQPPTDGRRASAGASPTTGTRTGDAAARGNPRSGTAGAAPSQKTGGHFAGGFYAPMTPPGTPKPAPMQPQQPRANGGITASTSAARATASVSASPGLGESTHFNDQSYELPGLT